MSDTNPVPTLPRGILSDEQVQKISGGDCTPQEVVVILGQLKDTYESLIDFTSYVIERVATP
jgi:hypothetical protein